MYFIGILIILVLYNRIENMFYIYGISMVLYNIYRHSEGRRISSVLLSVLLSLFFFFLLLLLFLLKNSLE